MLCITGIGLCVRLIYVFSLYCAVIFFLLYGPFNRSVIYALLVIAPGPLEERIYLPLLGSSDEGIRKVALEWLPKIDDAGIRKALDTSCWDGGLDGGPNASYTVARNLAPRALPILVAMIETGDFRTQANGATCIEALDNGVEGLPRAIPGLVRLMNETPPAGQSPVVYVAAAGLKRIAREFPQLVVPHMLEQFTQGPPEVRCQALDVLRSIGGTDAVTATRRAFVSKDPRMRLCASDFSSYIDPPAGVFDEDLILRLRDSDPDVRFRAVVTLSNQKVTLPPSSFDALIRIARETRDFWFLYPYQTDSAVHRTIAELEQQVAMEDARHREAAG